MLNAQLPARRPGALRRRWRAAALAVLALGLAPPVAGAAGPQLVSFDDLPNATIVDTQYAAQGVTFNEGPHATDTNLAHGGAGVAIQQCVGEADCDREIAMAFHTPQHTVSLWAAYDVAPETSLPVIMRLYDAQGTALQDVVGTITDPSTPVQLQVYRPEADIVTVLVWPVSPPGDTNEGLFVDDVSFDDTPQLTSAVILTSSVNPAAAGTPVSYLATVGPAPGLGTVGFFDGGVPIHGCEAVAITPGSPEFACTTTYAAAGGHTIVARFTGGGNLKPTESFPLAQTITEPPAPLIGDTALPVLPDDPPEPVRTLAVNISGGGKVVQLRRAGRTLAAVAGGIACGGSSFRCAVDVTPGASVTLQANAAVGYRFAGWSGVCSGAKRTCTVLLRFARNVTARFLPADGRALALSAGAPRATVTWRQSIGRGTLRVTGRLLARGRVQIELRRPDLRRGAIITKRINLRPGSFSRKIPLTAASLPRGLKLLPGAFIVSLRGSAAGRPLPLQMQSLVIKAPREGVVRRSFASATRDGRATPRLPAGATEAWAQFRLAAQAVASLPLSVSWYYPDGRLLGTIEKPNRETVQSYIALPAGLPSGRWVAELRAGNVVVQRLGVPIGA